MPKKAGVRRPAPAGRSEDQPLAVTIRGETAGRLTVPFGSALQQAASEWSRVLRNRARWVGQSDIRAAQARRARDTLLDLGVDLTDLGRLDGQRVVQVTVPYLDEETGWEARTFPWEFALTAGIERAPLVVRHLRRAVSEATQPVRAVPRDALPGPLPRALLIESVPRGLRERYSFEAERRLVAANLKGIEVEVLPDPTPEQAKGQIVDRQPELIHLAGFDSHQGAALLGITDPGHDGYLMVDDQGRPLPVGAQALGELLTAGDRVPRLVGLNFQSSAARLAALAVASGAEAAVGFQDRVDDALAEAFFAALYAGWRDTGWDILAAFERSLGGLMVRGTSLGGTGIVLWSATDLLPGRPALEAAVELAPGPSEPSLPGARASMPRAGAAPAGIAAPPSTSTTVPSPTIIASAPDLVVVPRHVSRVNYARLHNDQPLFESFVIHNSSGRPVEGVEVHVILNSGTDSFPYRATLRLAEGPTELKWRVKVPLTSSMLRGLREAVHSVLYISVRRSGHTIFEDTLPVMLAPMDEWASVDADDLWLPTFVLPGDPAVSDLVRASRGMLRVLRDRPDAAFDGYQAINPRRTDPSVPVDLQVKAIWSTLAFQSGIGYSEPPPSYADATQRLRTPTAVKALGAGTCIDLVLLVAACLESIGLLPVLVLYDGHASVGYWRGPAQHQAFRSVGGAGPPGGSEPTVSDPSPVPWVLKHQVIDGDPVVEELVRRVGGGELTLLESTLIGSGQGFTEATRAGSDLLQASQRRAGRAFRSLIDIGIARANGVTPLPLANG